MWYFPTSYFTDSEWESDFVDSWKEHIFPKWNLNSKLRILILKPEKCFLIPVQKKKIPPDIIQGRLLSQYLI